ncbi:MAG: CDP-alcohol phosphatidyltransferase family protein [Hyphomicrobiales bacterium]
MSIYQLKPAFQGLLRPFVQVLARIGITANMVTIFAAVFSVLYGFILFVSLKSNVIAWLVFLPVVLFIRMALNAIDGMLAREHNQQSMLGAYLNEICDLIADAAMIAPFALLAPFSPFWIIAILLLSWLTEFIGMMGVAVGASRRYDGPMGKSDRAFLFGALGLAAWAFDGLSPVLFWLQPLLALALIVTCVKRLQGALQEVKGASA